MIKRVFITALLVLATSLASFADEQKKITLNNSDRTTETIELAYCNIFVSLKDVDDNDNAEITIELENVHESNTLILFERAYDEKTLKKMSPSITYDKVFGGSKGKRYIDVCPDIRYTNQIKSSEKTKLFVKTGSEKTPLTCKLPIYIAKNKNKSGSKMLLLAKEVIELEIQVQLKPDEEFIRITDSYKSLIREIDSETFCTNKNHRGESLKVLKSKYEGKISDLKRTIKSIIDSRGYYPSDKAYKKFMEVSGNLDKIDLDTKVVSSCPKDRKNPIPGHNCKNCNLTYEQIYKKLENYYIDIHNGKKTKAQVMSEVESLYTCVSKNTKRSANNSIKSRITTYYNKIKSL